MLFKLSLVALICLVGSVSCSLQGRVVNGIDSDIKKYPFMVSLRDKMGIHKCGGTIVNKRYILTAAHCVHGRLASELSIQYGTTIISADSKNVINVKRIITHKDYDKLKKQNDIALLELVQDCKTVDPVKTPDPFFEVPNNKDAAAVVLLGWGAKSDDGGIESHLQEVKLKINFAKESRVLVKVLSTEVDEGRRGACFGDSGGPLLYKASVQLGIATSSPLPCASSYGFYTKVSHYTAWIAEHSK